MRICWTLETAQKLADKHNSNPDNKKMAVVRVGYDRWVVVHADKVKYFYEWKDQ